MPAAMAPVQDITVALFDLESDDPVVHESSRRIALRCLNALENLIPKDRRINALCEFYMAAVEVIDRMPPRQKGE